jgi:hypothetical protein
MKHSAHRQHDHVRPEPPTTAVLEDSFWPGQLVLPTSYICWGKSNGTRARAGLMAFPPCYRSHFSFRYKLGGLLRYAFLFCFVISFHSPAYHFGLAVQRRGITSTARSAAPQIWASMMSEPPVGIEPTTVRLRSACSANWALEAHAKHNHVRADTTPQQARCGRHSATLITKPFDFLGFRTPRDEAMCFIVFLNYHLSGQCNSYTLERHRVSMDLRLH